MIEPLRIGFTLDADGETEGVDNEAALVGDMVWLVDGGAVAVGAVVPAHEATRRPITTPATRRLTAWVPMRPGMGDSPLHCEFG